MGKTLNPGDMVSFGCYEQDGDLDNGPEPMRWQVLDVRGDMALLFSAYVLEAMPYGPDRQYVSWEASDIRFWLNSEFLAGVLTREEQDAVCMARTGNGFADGAPGGMYGGNRTLDSVFLLSYAEALKYLGPPELFTPDPDDPQLTHISYPWAGVSTPYAELRGVSYGYWWLRSPGSGMNNATIGSSCGVDNAWMAAGWIGVRPALWIRYR